MGLLWGIIVAITLVVAGLFGAGVPGLPELAASVLGGVIYGVIGGAVTAIIYNAAASLTAASVTTSPEGTSTVRSESA